MKCESMLNELTVEQLLLIIDDIKDTDYYVVENGIIYQEV